MRINTYCELPSIGTIQEPRRWTSRAKLDPAPDTIVTDALAGLLTFKSGLSNELQWVRNQLDDKQKPLIDTLLTSSDPATIKGASQQLRPFVVSFLQGLMQEPQFKRATSLVVDLRKLTSQAHAFLGLQHGLNSATPSRN